VTGVAALGADPADEDLAGTPRGVAAAYAELLTPVPFTSTTFANDEGYDELVVARDIPFSSLCRHHLLPFTGVAHVGYLPGDRILWVVQAGPGGGAVRPRPPDPGAAHRPGRRLAHRAAGPQRAGVVVDAEHLCMTVRGVQAPGVRTVTSALRGRIRDDPGPGPSSSPWPRR
jgi:GTP cyclohydrolase IA